METGVGWREATLEEEAGKIQSMRDSFPPLLTLEVEEWVTAQCMQMVIRNQIGVSTDSPPSERTLVLEPERTSFCQQATTITKTHISP
jgi:hypothetical protein